jgi:archaemetzincin
VIRVGIQSVGEVDSAILDRLSAQLASVLPIRVRIRPDLIDPVYDFDPNRGQYYSTSILKRLSALPRGRDDRILGVTQLDLFVPVLTFVFGEAQLNGDCALVSCCRLSEEFYGLPANVERSSVRLIKEAVHELGHTFALLHCGDWRCVMASSHGIERLDAKGTEFCRECRNHPQLARFLNCTESSQGGSS